MNQKINDIINELKSIEAEIGKINAESFSEQIYVAAAQRNVNNAIDCLKQLQQYGTRNNIRNARQRT